MIDVLKEPCLVLNQIWIPIATITVQDAVTTLHGDFVDHRGKTVKKATILDQGMDESGNTYAMTYDWTAWMELPLKEGEPCIRAGGFGKVFRVPEIIIVKRYKDVPKNQGTLNRKNLFKRDQGICQYCGECGANTVDHVLPRSKGGKNSWDNCVACCFACNQKKKNHTLEEASMTLLKKPCKPGLEILRNVNNRKKSWEVFFKDKKHGNV